VLGIAAQLATVACLSQKAISLHGGVLNTNDSSDLILAAFGLLNVKMALIASFAMLMFVLFLISFLYNKCKTKKFVSWKGSTTFNIWALIYETIETSTVDTVLKFLCSASGDDEQKTKNSYHSCHTTSGSASLAFSTDSTNNQISPAYQAQGVPLVLTMETTSTDNYHLKTSPVYQAQGVSPVLTMETTFVNQYGFDFKASLHCLLCHIYRVVFWNRN
jgi:hypothetical protein